MTDVPNEHHLTSPSPDETDSYLDEIDHMDLEELEGLLPKAQGALDSIESKLEELMGVRDAALVCAAAMAARLAALKQTEERAG